MRQFLFTILLFILCVGAFYSCKKYADPAPGSAPQLTNPYCNDPAAVNYNVGFPGKPDNTTCIYPSDLFAGTYWFHDTVRIISSGLFISADSFEVRITHASSTDKAKIGVSGFCGGSVQLLFTANATYTATSDTTIGDTTTLHIGQRFCNVYDTLQGTLTRDRVSDSVLYIDFKVYSDTATYSHQGVATKK